MTTTRQNKWTWWGS